MGMWCILYVIVLITENLTNKKFKHVSIPVVVQLLRNSSINELQTQVTSVNILPVC